MLDLNVYTYFIFGIVFIWDFVWKGIGLWKSGRNNQLTWFVCILFFNTIGVLPLLYILFFQKSNFIKKVAKKK